mgnify:CR=1 FL=1
MSGDIECSVSCEPHVRDPTELVITVSTLPHPGAPSPLRFRPKTRHLLLVKSPTPDRHHPSFSSPGAVCLHPRVFLFPLHRRKPSHGPHGNLVGMRRSLSRQKGDDFHQDHTSRSTHLKGWQLVVPERGVMMERGRLAGDWLSSSGGRCLRHW